ncbi:hypothetical protein SEUCBS139899_006322 [Sporothrix eucalyptigena]|uniref:Uncharacterized protein n=1 Tax=Sporothrix eucalyptigena TaxID=1812306 RepID=A0ABP0D2P9_9PEZI
MAVSVDTSATRIAAPTGEGATRMLTPPPQSARTELADRMGDFTLNSPVADRDRSEHHQLPPSPGKSARSGSTFFAQNRAILLSGLPQSPVSSEGSAPQPLSPVRQGRRGLPSHPQQQQRHLTPLVTVHPPPHPHHRQPQHYYDHPQSAVGPNAPPYSPLQSPRTISPVVNVKAVPIGYSHHRGSISSTRSALTADKNGSEDDKTKATNSDAGLTPPPEGRLLVSAYIVPANKDRKSFHLRREFDLQELLDAVPRPPLQSLTDRRYRSSINILASPIAASSPRTPLSARPPTSANERGPPGPPPPTSGEAGPNYTTGMKRPASDHLPNLPASPHPNRRRHAAAGKDTLQPSQKEMPPPDQFLADGAVLIPIRPHPSLGGLPALAAIILSRHVEAGDVIELPLPHPESWPQTVSHVYHGRAELTDKIRKNIEHLGGKCE